MSPQNVELVRRALMARRSEFTELLDPAVRLDLPERVFNPAVYEGYEGIMRWRAEVGDVRESYRSEPEEFFDGDEVFWSLRASAVALRAAASRSISTPQRCCAGWVRFG